MIEIKKGQIITVSEKARSGEGQNGKYIMIPVEAEKGYDKITVWAANASDFDISGKGSVRVREILSVKKSKRKYQEKFYDNYDCNCTLEAVEDVAFGDDRESVISDDEDLPFV